nr:hypothetical protein [Tanacetum cinerariifolium]
MPEALVPRTGTHRKQSMRSEGMRCNWVKISRTITSKEDITGGLVLGFPSISPTIVVAGVKPLSGKSPRPKILSYPLYIIKSPQSSIVTACGVVPSAVNIARLCSFSTAHLPSFAITGNIDSVKSILTQSALDALCDKFYIPDVVHHALPGHNDRIRNNPTGKNGVYSRGHVIPLADVNDQGNVNVQGVSDDDVNEGDGDVAKASQTEQGEHVIDVRGIDVVANDEVQAIVVDMPQRVRKKRKAADGASGSGLPPKKLREDHERFVVSSESSHDLNPNVTDDEVTSVIRSSMPPPPVLTAAVSTTIIIGSTSASVYESGAKQVRPSIFKDFASPSMVEADAAGPLQPLLAKFNVGTALQVCFSAEIRMQLEHKLRGRQKFEGKCAMQANWLKERDAKTASLKVQLSLKEAEAAEVIRLRGQVSIVDAAEAARASELNSLKEQNAPWAETRGYEMLKSPEYLTALGGVVGRAIDKGIHDGLAAGIDHGKAERVLAEVAAYDPITKANYVTAVNALCPVAEAPKAEQLQPSPGQLMRPIHRLEDQVVIGETFVSFSLDLAYAQNLICKASTSGVPAAVAITTTLSTTFVEAGSVPPIPHVEAPPSSIVFEMEELDTTPKHTSAS